MVRRAFIQEQGSGRMEPEMRDLLTQLRAQGVPAETFTSKRLERRQLPLDRETLVAGDVPVVLGALAQLGSGESTAGYGVDFGVLSMGETALVEWNDGFSLGAYGLDKALYTELTVARWNELTAPKQPPQP